MIKRHTPLVSLAMPVYNAAPYLPQAIESILSQRYENLELVICDNCSTDASPIIAQQYASKDKRIHFYANQWNIGFSGNLQKCTSLVSGDFVLVHAADDFLLPNALEQYLGVVQENISCAENAVVSSDFLVVNQQGERLSRQTLDHTIIQHLHIDPKGDGIERPMIQHYHGQDILSARFPILATIGWIGSTMFSKKLYDRVEGYFSNHWINPDKFFMFKLLSLNPDFFWLREAVACYRLHDFNQNSQQAATGILKFPMDQYAYTFEFSDAFMKEFGGGRQKMIYWFVDRECLGPSLREIAVGSRMMGFRYLCFGLATYPAVAFRNVKTYLALLAWITGPIGRLLSSIVYRSKIWRTAWR